MHAADQAVKIAAARPLLGCFTAHTTPRNPGASRHKLIKHPMPHHGNAVAMGKRAPVLLAPKKLLGNGNAFTGDYAVPYPARPAHAHRKEYCTSVKMTATSVQQQTKAPLKWRCTRGQCAAADCMKHHLRGG